MQERIIKAAPGVLAGVSTHKAYPEKCAYFYDGDFLRLTLHLNQAMPPKTIDGQVFPGDELDMFFNKSIIMKYPEGVEIEVVAA